MTVLPLHVARDRGELAKDLAADLHTALEDLSAERVLTETESHVLIAVECWLRGYPLTFMVNS